MIGQEAPIDFIDAQIPSGGTEPHSGVVESWLGMKAKEKRTLNRASISDPLVETRCKSLKRVLRHDRPIDEPTTTVVDGPALCFPLHVQRVTEDGVCMYTTPLSRRPGERS